ncbi:hypothetical protein EZV62_027283 [Acer yangbiense]|uniref:Uncharacterized protein n=1 Tax=Acer yangbiense TaxID=1000413 RepID=A0A5C7GU42_9ROSI|nr:hypothetical protein EZV62_027283 [Acer yangbiense]
MGNLPVDSAMVELKLTSLERMQKYSQVADLPFPSPCLGLSKEEQKTLRTGVYYGSSAYGVLPDTGKLFTGLFETTVKNLKPLLDSPKKMADFLSKSLFFISIGNADISTSYDFLDNTMKQQTPFPKFAHAISQKFSDIIKDSMDFFMQNSRPSYPSMSMSSKDKIRELLQDAIASQPEIV